MGRVVNVYSTVRSRQVSAELRRLREDLGLSAAEVAATLGMHPSKLSRIETGKRGLQPTEVAALLGHYRVPEKRREELLTLVTNQDRTGWWQSQGAGLPELWRDLIDLESRATRVQNFELAFIPGLLQTAEYAATVINGIRPNITDDQLARLVRSRLTRQLILGKLDKQFTLTIDEGALHRSIGEPGLMHRQLNHLLDGAQRSNVVLRVVPRAAGAHAGLRGPFIIMDFADEPTVVHIENHATSMFPESKEDVAAYRQAMTAILGAALSPADSTALIAAIAAATPAGAPEEDL